MQEDLRKAEIERHEQYLLEQQKEEFDLYQDDDSEEEYDSEDEDSENDED